MPRCLYPLTLPSLGYTTAKELTSVGRLGTAMSQFGWNATYDAKSRLDTWTRTGFTTPNEDYALDAAGNWNELKLNGTVSQTRTHFTSSGAPGKNQIVTLNGNSFTHDARGNMLQNDQGDTFTYDILNQLKSSNVIVGSNNPVSTYKYDALGRRVRQTVVDGSSTVLDKIYFYGPDFKLLESADITTATSSSFVISTSSFITVVWGRSFNELVWTSADGYLHGDQINSVIGNSNSSGTVTKVLTYTPYGGRSEWTLSGTTLTAATFAIGEMDFGYSGELRDPTGLIYYGYRYYSPELGRWINRDPIGESGGVNLYEMVFGLSVSHFDKYGLELFITQREGSRNEAGPLHKLEEKAKIGWGGSTTAPFTVEEKLKKKLEGDPSFIEKGKAEVAIECTNLDENPSKGQQRYRVFIRSTRVFDVKVDSFVINDKTGVDYTENGLTAIKEHEKRRVDVYKMAYENFLRPFDGAILTMCNTEVNLNLQQATNYQKKLHDWLVEREDFAKTKFLAWVKNQQEQISLENHRVFPKAGPVQGIREPHKIGTLPKFDLTCPSRR